MNKKVIAATAAAVMLAASLVPASAALAADAGHTPVIVPGEPVDRPTGLYYIDSLDVGPDGSTYQADPGRGQLTKTTAAGVTTTLVPPHLQFTVAVAQHNGRVYYVDALPESRIGGNFDASLLSVPTSGGTPTQVVDLAKAYDGRTFDVGNSYYFVGLPKSCVAQFDSRSRTPATQSGGSYPLPTQAVATPAGLYITDLGFNSVVKVTYDGKLSVAAVLPPITFTATSEFLFNNMYPDCALGYKFRAPARPTGITAGPNGLLYVISGPGEGIIVPPRLGAIYKVDPATGTSTRIIGGLLTPAGVAATPSGTLYVADGSGGSNGAGGISVVRVNSQVARPLVDVDGASRVRFSKDKLYVARTSFEGSIPEVVVPLNYK